MVSSRVMVLLVMSDAVHVAVAALVTLAGLDLCWQGDCQATGQGDLH
jgi:hypothetical protein